STMALQLNSKTVSPIGRMTATDTVNWILGLQCCPRTRPGAAVLVHHPRGAEYPILLERSRHQPCFYAGRQKLPDQHKLGHASRRLLAAQDQPLVSIPYQCYGAFLSSEDRGIKGVS